MISEQGRSQFRVRKAGHPEQAVLLRDGGAIERLFAGGPVGLDISGLGHQVWAPLLRKCLDVCDDFTVVYAEPGGYRRHPSPSSATSFDLSRGFHGVEPLPGLVQLGGPKDESQALLVAFLGFEGNRARYIAQHLDPEPKIIPVVGVPGFQVEFPAFTVACNADFLGDAQAQNEIRFARASCPFEAYDVLQELHRDYPAHYFYIAPVGTKPHALGAVRYAIEHSDHAEVMYDHPERKADRTSGLGMVHVYRFASP